MHNKLMKSTSKSRWSEAENEILIQEVFPKGLSGKIRSQDLRKVSAKLERTFEACRTRAIMLRDQKIELKKVSQKAVPNYTSAFRFPIQKMELKDNALIVQFDFSSFQQV